jgi:hypothetical protein
MTCAGSGLQTVDEERADAVSVKAKDVWRRRVDGPLPCSAPRPLSSLLPGHHVDPLSFSLVRLYKMEPRRLSRLKSLVKSANDS